MGTVVGQFTVDADKARSYAASFDPHPPHLTGEANEVLPARSVSGFYVLAEAIALLVANDNLIVCGSAMQVSWVKPVLEGQIVRVEAAYPTAPPRRRTTELTIFADDRLAAIVTIHHLVREPA